MLNKAFSGEYEGNKESDKGKEGESDSVRKEKRGIVLMDGKSAVKLGKKDVGKVVVLCRHKKSSGTYDYFVLTTKCLPNEQVGLEIHMAQKLHGKMTSTCLNFLKAKFMDVSFHSYENVQNQCRGKINTTEQVLVALSHFRQCMDQSISDDKSTRCSQVRREVLNMKVEKCKYISTFSFLF